MVRNSGGGGEVVEMLFVCERLYVEGEALRAAAAVEAAAVQHAACCRLTQERQPQHN